jgi:hypothetical protein
VSDIIDFIKRQKDKKTVSEFANLLKPPKKEKYDEIPHISNNIIIPAYLHQADLLYLPTDKFGFKYALVVVDVYDKKCDAVPLKLKTPEAVVSGLKKIYERKIIKVPHVLQFDQGSEFKGAVKDYAKDNKIRLKYTLTNRHRQNAVVEAKNKAIGGYIMKYQNEKELETGKQVKGWVDALPYLIKYLNDTLPVKKGKPLTDDIITTEYSADLIPLHTKVRAVLDYPISAYNKSKLKGTFRTGDIRWGKEPRTVEKIILNPNMPPMYQLDAPKGFETRVAYTKNQLQVILDNEVKLKNKAKD